MQVAKQKVTVAENVSRAKTRSVYVTCKAVDKISTDIRVHRSSQ